MYEELFKTKISVVEPNILSWDSCKENLRQCYLKVSCSTDLNRFQHFIFVYLVECKGDTGFRQKMTVGANRKIIKWLGSIGSKNIGKMIQIINCQSRGKGPLWLLYPPMAKGETITMNSYKEIS